MSKSAHFYCYGIIGESDPLFQAFTGQPDPIISAAKVAEFLNSLPKEVDEIIVHMNSRGGSVFEGFAIHDLLTTSDKKITTIAEGLVASIATVVFLAGQKRKITENSQLMIHNPWIDPMLISGLTADEIQKMADDMKVEENKIVDFYANKTHADKTTLSEMMREETFLSSDEALELKFATEIITPVKAFATLNKKSHSNNNEIMNKLFASTEKKIDAIMNYLQGKSKTVDIKAMAHTTSDDKTINIDGGILVGSTVTDDEGNPTPSSSFTLEDGTVIKTDSDSKISDITPPVSAEAQVVKIGDTLKNEKGELHINAEHKISDTITAKTNDKGEVIELIDSTQTPDIKALNEKIETLEASLQSKDNEIASFKLAQNEIEKKINIIAKNIQSNAFVIPGKTNLRTDINAKENRISSLKEDRKKEREKQTA